MDYTSDMKSFLAWEAALSRDTVDVKMAYIDLASGDHAAGILLSQIIYWYMLPSESGKTKLRVRRDGYYWIAKGRDEWWAETRLTARQFDRASKVLERAGLIEKSTYKFAGVPQMHVRLKQDAFLKAWNDLITGVEVSEEGGVKSTSPNGKVHIQRVPEKDKDFTDKSVKSNMSKSEKEEEEEEEEEEKRHSCPSCGRSDGYAAPVSIDPKGRCAWCFVCDAWKKYIGVRVPRKYQEDENGRKTMTGMGETQRKKAFERFKSQEFSDAFVFLIQRAGYSEHLATEGFFTIEYLLRDDVNWRKIVNGTFDGFDKQNYPASWQRLSSWLTSRRTQTPAGLQAGPQTLGQMGG